jgi:hypothetical protein
LCPEAFEVLQQLAPGPRQYGATVSRLLVQEQVRREVRAQERQRIAQELLEEVTTVLAGQ